MTDFTKKQEIRLLRKLAKEHFTPYLDSDRMIRQYICPICDNHADYIDGDSYLPANSRRKAYLRYILLHEKKCYWYKKEIKHIIYETVENFGYRKYKFSFKEMKLTNEIPARKDYRQ